MIDLLLQLLDAELPVPSQARRGDGGFDLYARHDAILEAAGGRAVIDTGVAFALPADHVGLVLPRSGLAAQYGITCLNAPGLIDTGYRGEIKVVLLNTDPREDYAVKRGDRVAQLLVVAAAHFTLQLVEELPASERGSGGLGHTGR